MAGGGGLAECRTSAPPHFPPRDVQGVARALLRRPALLPTALLRLRCLVWVDSTSCSSDDADDPYFMTAMAGMVPSDLLMKRVSSPAPRGLLTSFFQTRSLDALAPGAPPAGTLQLNARRLGSLPPPCRTGVAWHAR